MKKHGMTRMEKFEMLESAKSIIAKIREDYLVVLCLIIIILLLIFLYYYFDQSNKLALELIKNEDVKSIKIGMSGLEIKKK